VTTRYVSGKKGKDSNPGTQAEPYEHIQYAIDQVRAALKKGGTKPGQVLIEDALYHEELTLYDDIDLMRADQRVVIKLDTVNGTYKSLVTDHVEISRQKKGGPLITIAGVKRATIRGLVIDGHKIGGRGIDISGSSNITIEGCLIWRHWTEVDYKGTEKGTLDDPYNGDLQVKDSSSGAGIRIRESKTIDIDGNYFDQNRCDLKYAIPSPFDTSKLPSTITLETGGQSKKITDKCAIRLLRMMAEVYRNGGGAIFAENSSGVNIEGNLFLMNKGARGGAIRFGNKAYEWIHSNYFGENEAWIDGGAIAIWDYDRSDPSRKQLLIRDCTFSENSSADDGGAVYLTAKTLARIQQCTFDSNRSGSNGGALRVTFGSIVSVEGSTFTNNVANADADTKITDNKDGGGAIAVQNADLTAKKCTFHGNRVRGFAGGALYVNTVKYDPILESIGTQVYGENFSDILKTTYKFLEAQLEIVDCTFSENDASGKTCYAPSLSIDDKIAVLHADDCGDLLKVWQYLEKKKQCSLSKGTGMTEGGAGGAIYILEEKTGYLPLDVLIRRSDFKDDVSEHNKKEQRAEIVALECSSFQLDNVTISVASPTVYKLSLHNLVMKNAAASGQSLICSNSKVSTSDSEIYLRGVTCQ
jgi:predicted outer membrane repeat protein